MRILMLAQFYPPTIGGEERHVRNLSIELAERGHQVAVATLCQENAPECTLDRGVRIYRIRSSTQRVPALFSEKGRRHAPPFPDPEAVLALARIIAEEQPNIVHAHNWLVHSFLPIKAKSKARLVVTLHDTSLLCATKRYMYQQALCSGPAVAKCLRCTTQHYGATKGIPTTLANTISGMVERHLVDMFLPVSQAIAEVSQLAKHSLPYRILPNFIPDDLCRSVMNHARTNEDPFMAQLPQEGFLLYVGDLAHDKGVGVLLQAYAQLQQQIPLVLIGRRVDCLCAELPPNVLLLHSLDQSGCYLPHQAVMSAWNRCTIALIPSLCLDACPTVAIEAMAMGKPIVASHIGGLPNIIVDGQTGILVPPGDPRALQQAIQRLLDDPAGREQMGVMAKQRVVKFQACTVVPRIERVYHEVLG